MFLVVEFMSQVNLDHYGKPGDSNSLKTMTDGSAISWIS